MKQKSGAIQLSMGTIIIVILGVTLLSLALIWIRGYMGKITDLSEDAFLLSEQEIDSLFSDSDSLLKIMPDNIEMKKGKSAEVGVIFYNLEGATLRIQAQVEPIAAGVPVTCKLGDTLTATSKEYDLASGSSKRIKLRVETTKETTLGAGGCDLTITSLTSEDTDYSLTEQLLVDVIG